MKYDYDLFVIGGGSAGVRCARIAAGHGARVGIAEERFWGGTCVNVGCVPKKLLDQAGEYGPGRTNARGFGWDIQKGSHDWRRLIAAKDREIDRLNGIYLRLLNNAGATVHEARATFVDAHTLEVGRRARHRRADRDRGRRPTRAPRHPRRRAGHRVRRRLPSAGDAKRVLLVGGGYIAVEFAGIFAGLGAEVDLVYRQALPIRASTRTCARA